MISFRSCRTALIVLVALSVMAAHADNLKVKTDRGRIQGKPITSGKGAAFLGIPYALPPVGPLRWTAPVPAARWHGVRDATQFGYHCMQPNIYKDMIFHDPGPSEDCLTLNVWTPSVDKHAKLPVMVWIYGGGYLAGSTSEARQDGQYLAQKGVVVVSMNYRLGIFGFMALSSLANESPHHAAGNYGLLDQAAALAWVKRNIQAFGGDPQNITLFGESAGSFSVSAQMASPLAKDLLAHAIGESGGALGRSGLAFPPLQTVEKTNESFVQSAFGTTDLAGLRAITADKILAAASEKGSPRFSPVVDGYFLPESVPDIYAEGKQADIPLLAGWNRDEGTAQVISAPEKVTLQSYESMAEKEFGARAQDFLRVYAATDDAQALRAAEDYAGDRFIAFSTWAWLEAQVKTGDAAVYRYKFDRPSPGDAFHAASSGAFHSDDIEYVFGTLNSRQGAVWNPDDYKLSALMETYWTNFARTGNPNAPGSPDWPRYDAADGWMVMHLDADSAARPDEHRDRYLFLQSQQELPR